MYLGNEWIQEWIDSREELKLCHPKSSLRPAFRAWHCGYSTARLTLGHQHAIIHNEILKDKDQVCRPCIPQSLMQSLANIRFPMWICSALEETMLRLQTRRLLLWWLWGELHLCTVCMRPGPPWHLSHPCLSFLISLSTQTSPYQTGSEVATRPAALRTVTVCLSHLLWGTGGLWRCFPGQAHHCWFTEERLTEFRVVVPCRPRGQTQWSWMKRHRIITRPRPMCKGRSCDQ